MLDECEHDAAVAAVVACRLADAGRIGDALNLMDRAVAAMFDSDPNPRANWKDKHANRWRPFLRKVAISERSSLPAHIDALAKRVEYLAQHLIEVSGQELVDIGRQLRELRTAELSASMLSYVRRTSVWAGVRAWRRRGPTSTPRCKLSPEHGCSGHLMPRTPTASERAEAWSSATRSHLREGGHGPEVGSARRSYGGAPTWKRLRRSVAGERLTEQGHTGTSLCPTHQHEHAVDQQGLPAYQA